MKTYRIFFEFYGRKMQTVLTAESKDAAKKVVQQKLTFIKIETAENPFEQLKKIIGL